MTSIHIYNNSDLMQVIPSLFLHIYELVLIIKLVKYIYPKYNNVTYIIFK